MYGALAYYRTQARNEDGVFEHRHPNGIPQELDRAWDERYVPIVNQTPTATPNPLISLGGRGSAALFQGKSNRDN
jgi:hypothetical protein